MPESDRFDITKDPAELSRVFSEMERRQMISASSKNLAVQGGAIIPQMMGGPVARQVGPTSHRSLFIVDASGSMDDVIDALRQSMRSTRDTMVEIHQETGVRQLMGVVAFNTQPWVVFPYTDATQITDDTFDTLTARGATALYDAVGNGILGDAGYGFLLQEQGAIGEESSVFVYTDTEENSSRKYGLADLNRLMVEGRKTRRRRFGAFGFGYNTGWVKQNLLDMGFHERNIILFKDGFTNKTIKQAFFQSSQSIKQVSVAISQGASASMPSQSPGDAADNMMFT